MDSSAGGSGGWSDDGWVLSQIRASAARMSSVAGARSPLRLTCSLRFHDISLRMPEPRHVPALDTLRAFAILSVVVHHFMVASPNLLPVSGEFMRNLITSGRVGVDLFFVLSGYLIARILLRDLESHPHLHLGSFLWRRWTRTFPAYFATLLLIVAGHQLIGRSGGALGPGASWSDFVPDYFLFTQNYTTPLTHFTWSWSLCIEEHFYVALPLLILVARRLWPRVTGITLLRSIALGGFAATVALRLAGIAAAGPGFEWMRDIYFRTHTHLDGITAGVFLATSRRHGTRGWGSPEPWRRWSCS